MEQGKRPPLWAIKALGAPDYRLLWWMLQHCDHSATLAAGWRQRAEADLGWTRVHLFKTVRKLVRKEIVIRDRYDRAVKLNMKAFQI
jgi:hypothetical protein